MLSLRAFLVLVLCSVLALAQWPNPEPCSGNCHVHDPSLVRRTDGTYFLFGSAPNISVKTAPSINGPWTLIPGGLVPGGGIQLGAPDVQRISDNMYYLYYQRTTIGSQNSNISWGVSQTLEPGNWTFGGHVHNLPKGNAKTNYNRIDPNLLVLNNGSDLYLSFGSYWDDIFQFKMENVSTAEPGTLTHLAENVTTYDSAETNVGPNPLEGSSQFAWQYAGTMYYYLFFSSGACCKSSSVVPLGDEYKIFMCRSSNPTGPFSDRNGKSCLDQNGGTMIMGSHDDVYAPGGQGVTYDEALGEVILYYHYRELSLEKPLS